MISLLGNFLRSLFRLFAHSFFQNPTFFKPSFQASAGRRPEGAKCWGFVQKSIRSHPG